MIKTVTSWYVWFLKYDDEEKIKDVVELSQSDYDHHQRQSETHQDSKR